MIFLLIQVKFQVEKLLVFSTKLDKSLNEN